MQSILELTIAITDGKIVSWQTNLSSDQWEGNGPAQLNGTTKESLEYLGQLLQTIQYKVQEQM